MHGAGVANYVLDADNLRQGINGDLGFSDDDRTENIRRVAHISRLLTETGLITFVPIISPFAAGRNFARKVHADDGLDFIEVHLATPLSECERRDPKGLYARARSGEMAGMTGIDSPYEAPQNADIVLGRGTESVTQCANSLVNAINLILDLKN